jgi:hypothetical protein
MTSAALTDPITELWTTARRLLAAARAEFGTPADVAFRITRKWRSAFKRKLTAIELLLSKLLLVEAARLSPSWSARPPARNPSPPKRAGGPRSRPAADAPAFDPEAPDSWRVSFRVRIPTRDEPKKRETGPRIRDLGPPLLMRDVWKDNERRWRLAQMKRMRDRANWPANAKAKAIRLARRYEAIKRLLADPRAAVLTLARRLRKLGAGAYLAARRIARAIVPRYIRERDPHVRALVAAYEAMEKFREPSSDSS